MTIGYSLHYNLLLRVDSNLQINYYYECYIMMHGCKNRKQPFRMNTGTKINLFSASCQLFNLKNFRNWILEHENCFKLIGSFFHLFQTNFLLL